MPVDLGVPHSETCPHGEHLSLISLITLKFRGNVGAFSEFPALLWSHSKTFRPLEGSDLLPSFVARAVPTSHGQTYGAAWRQRCPATGTAASPSSGL